MVVLLQIFAGMAMKLLTTKAVEDLTLFALDKLSKATESKVDDELVTIVKRAIKGEPEEKKAE